MKDRTDRAHGTSQSQSITGKIIKVHYSNPNGRFTTGKIEVKPGSYTGVEEITDDDLLTRVEFYSRKPFSHPQGFSLFGQVAEGDTVKLVGIWKDDPKYGAQFAAQGAIFELPISEDGLITYISENPEFKGFGKSGARAIRLVSFFSGMAGGLENFSFNVNATRPGEISAAARVSVDDAEHFKKVWAKRSAVNAIASQLAAYELTHSQIEKIIEVFKDAALSILKANPYALIGQVDGFGFATVDKIALKTGVKKDDPRRVASGVMYAVLQEAEQGGHTWISRPALVDAANKILILDCPPTAARAMITKQLDELLDGERPKLYQDLDGRVSLTPLYDAEQMIGSTLARLGVEENPYFQGVEPEALPEIYAGLNEGQTAAVESALSNMALVITGGAGSGKSFLAGKIIRAYQKIGVNLIEICAPTGKAAKRMEEVLQAAGIPRGVQTIHRLLGYDGRGFNTVEIEAQLLIVDESSMIDALLFAAICYRLRRGTAIIFLGDADQLPPVGAGNPLRDILNKNICPVVRLTQVVRQAGALRVNCLDLLNHRVAKQGEPDERGIRPWIRCDGIGDAENCKEYLKILFDLHVHRLGFDLLYEVQCLTAQKDGPVGVKELNRVLQVIYQAKRGNTILEDASGGFGAGATDNVKEEIDGRKKQEGKSPEPRSFYTGDRVIYTRNNYDLLVFNGDVGVIRSIKFKSGKELDQKYIEVIVVAFGAKNETDGRLVEVPRSSLSDLSLAYALTVHKYQGSQIKCVVLVAHKSHAFMHQNQGVNWIYTGATRSQETLILVGDTWGINNAAAHDAKEKRRTWLALMDGPLRVPERGDGESYVKEEKSTWGGPERSPDYLDDDIPDDPELF